MVKEAFKRTGAYYYYFPTMSQGRKILWDGIDRDGMRFLDHVPAELVKKKNEQEMKIWLVNGSLIQIVGTDRLEVVGPNPVGCIFSEYALQNPRGWQYVIPILVENKGWAIFNFTPRGMNHAHELYQRALDDPNWFCELLTIDDTGAITPEEVVEEAKTAGMSEELVQQEFYCSFEYGLEGAYYLKQINQARKEDRIGRVPYDPYGLVHTVWDLGVRDATAIWFFQVAGLEVHLIGYYENSGHGLSHYAHELGTRHSDRGWTYGRHFAPHDIEVRELGSGQSRLEMAVNLGISFEIVPSRDISIMDGIEAVRNIFYRCWFDREECADGLHALMNYRKKWDDVRACWQEHPYHDWASNGADAFRYLAIAVGAHASSFSPVKKSPVRRRPRPPTALAA